MNWKFKAMVMDLLARFPETLSYPAYYAVQRLFGGLKQLDPTPCFRAAVALADRVGKYRNPDDLGTFLEIGTGRHLSLPIALWLCGARKVITLDLNPFLSEEMVKQSIGYLKNNIDMARSIFGEHFNTPLFQERFRLLSACQNNISSIMATANIEYLAPADAQHLDLPDNSIDYHVSYTVFEHIPPQIIINILKEGKRVVKPGGMFLHLIDFADHFSYSDKSITAVNFLQYSDAEWDKLANNRYAYHNRLRSDEFLDLLSQADLNVLSSETYMNQRSLEELRSKRLHLDDRFSNKNNETNATIGMFLTATNHE